ncbi:2-isopropylmalate synthase [Succinatimonas hippei]|uniref:2-isopropylmalate synthase n=1 Tax=Succinatimonas hippei (strain DSM 22608 / JCM 16073 / KCTC 15190 / YIT 12066) TaxID=762983 RepID=E8LJ14_SUCHY|nr:2-isopropylmalate synthase [Succinatimonas hippei]EFY07495.1 2-isopropylmalate synthase [Succinatimonas hippei YIT 12066]MCL1602741.1 2-isopropylmalate synthase [Succinatimonas hippei]MDM8120641.1 2-isopropylmalate synthase [Succinatimonas hippei]
MAINDDKRVIIFDTTLRDGEQALQSSLSPKQKLQIAMILDQLGVDVIEAGFPISSPGDMEAVRLIGQNLKNATVCGLSRAVDKDIDACYEAMKGLDHYRIHTFIATSDIHVQDKLKKSFDDVVEMAVRAVTRARKYTDDVEFSCEDAGRTPIDHLCRTVEAAIKAGATTVNIPDTVGYTLPYEFGNIIKSLFDRVPNIDKAVISVHCHNDLGMATANSLTALQNGARQIEVAVNGLGERAGNCSLEEVAMTIKTRSEYMGGLYTGIVSTNIARASQVVAGVCNEPVPPHKAIVGSNAFAHSSGIHQDGVLKNRSTYEIITPESVGFKENNLHMTARSGRHMIKSCLASLGYDESTYDLDDVYARFLKLADRKGQVFDYDLEALLFFSPDKEEETQFELESLNVISGGKNVIPTASVRLKIGKRTRTESGTGNGPVDAVFNCITRLTGIRCELTNYVIAAKGSGMNAQGQVDVDVMYQGRQYHGKGLSTDVIESSALALIHACNSIYRARIIADEKLENKEK